MKSRTPGWAIIDWLMPDATQAERDEAFENLRRFARVLLDQATREARARVELQKSRNGVSIDKPT